MRRGRLAGIGLVLLGIASAAADDRPAWLVGRWTGQEPGLQYALDLAADGRVRVTRVEEGDMALQVAGTWSWSSGRLRLALDAETTYEVAPRVVEGRTDEFTMSGGDFAKPVVFRRERPPIESLVGRWTFENEYQKVVTAYLPDGRYVTDLLIGDVVVHESGTVLIEGDEILFRSRTGETTAYRYALEGDELTLTGGPLGEMAQVYGKEAGSEKRVVEEARVADAAKAKEDAEWAARFPVAVMETRPAHVAAGEVPADPQPTRVFERPTVFGSPQAYVWISTQLLGVERATGALREKPVGDPDPEIDPGKGEYRNTTKWFFLPTGRFLYKGVRHVLGAPPDAAQVTLLWGRYRIEGDVLHVDSDDEEQQALDLLDGRRNLRFGEMTYGNVVWEEEALRRSAGR